MTKKTLLDGNASAAWGARLSRVQVVPNFPITPQTEIIETIAKWISDGVFKTEFLRAESEHSVMSAAVAASATGARVFTASSSQGLLLMHEVLYIASGMRLPIVMVNVSRGLSAPITLWPDHNDILDQRDSGWLMFFSETNQEVLDSVIMLYKICESRNVLLPAFINMDGFYQSYTREPVVIPDQKKVDKFLPPRKAKVVLDPEKPMAQGVGVMEEYPYFREQVHLAHKNALKVIEEVSKDWGKMFGRKYDLVESYMMDDADACLISIGANTTIAKAAVKKMRDEGKKIGLLRIRVFRPFPKDLLRKLVENVKAVGVIDQNVAPGSGGILFHEIRSALYGKGISISNFICALGGRPISINEYTQFANYVLRSADTKESKIFFQ